MATLTEDDVEKLFSGAPQFCARSEGPFISVPRPIVAFPFDEDLQIRDLTDHVQLESKAWSGVTTHPHITKTSIQNGAIPVPISARKKSNFYVRCSERPNMLSLQGLEKGTMGYEAALELSVSDSLEEEQFGFGSIGKKAQAIIDAREQMTSNDGWLHRISEPELLDRLHRNGEIHRNNDLKQRVSSETYNDLFRNFMRPRYIALDKKDTYSLTNQVAALLKCLGAPNVWIDLSHVEWRIRLGQILWGEQFGDKVDDDTHIHDVESEKDRAEEKYWLLLQILVATELLIRLDAITEGEEYGAGTFRPIDIVQFERAANPTVKWSLLLARSWLENIEVVRLEDLASAEPTLSATDGVPKRGWLASLASRMTSHGRRHHQNTATPPYHYIFRGRNAQRQVDGLTHFARKLRWPRIDAYESRISDHVKQAAQLMAAFGAPAVATKVEDKTSYFGTWDVTCQRGHHKERAQARRRKVAAALTDSGWLSKSYVFGLMLPGDGLSHFLMAALLENDSAALSKIGSFANLCGGFVYSGMSFWSTSCILGRVLAAGNGTAECMGWLSTDITPSETGDGWVNIDVQDVADDVSKLGKKSRIWAKRKIERQSFIVGDGNGDAVSPADFIIPHENRYSEMPPGVLVEVLSLQLAPSAQSLHPTPLAEIIPTPTRESFPEAPDLPSHPATLNFNVLIDGVAEKLHKISLYYDVNFVTAHPCAPSHRVRFVKSPSSPTIREVDASGSNNLGSGSRSVYRAGHPLHKSYNYKVMHITELIQRKHSDLSELISSPSDEKTPNDTVLVIDCMTSIAGVPQLAILQQLSTPSSSPVAERKPSFSAYAKMHVESRDRQFGSDMEILVRALCAEKGWNAIISRRRRGCLACAIREAGALAWKVIIRVD